MQTEGERSPRIFQQVEKNHLIQTGSPNHPTLPASIPHSHKGRARVSPVSLPGFNLLSQLHLPLRWWLKQSTTLPAIPQKALLPPDPSHSEGAGAPPYIIPLIHRRCLHLNNNPSSTTKEEDINKLLVQHVCLMSDVLWGQQEEKAVRRACQIRLLGLTACPPYILFNMSF